MPFRKMKKKKLEILKIDFYDVTASVLYYCEESTNHNDCSPFSPVCIYSIYENSFKDDCFTHMLWYHTKQFLFIRQVHI